MLSLSLWPSPGTQHYQCCYRLGHTMSYLRTATLCVVPAKWSLTFRHCFAYTKHWQSTNASHEKGKTIHVTMLFYPLRHYFPNPILTEVLLALVYSSGVELSKTSSHKNKSKIRFVTVFWLFIAFWKCSDLKCVVRQHWTTSRFGRHILVGYSFAVTMVTFCPFHELCDVRQPAWQGEKYIIPSQPHTGSKLRSEQAHFALQGAVRLGTSSDLVKQNPKQICGWGKEETRRRLLWGSFIQLYHCSTELHRGRQYSDVCHSLNSR